jgi:hypothetical protein
MQSRDRGMKSQFLRFASGLTRATKPGSG